MASADIMVKLQRDLRYASREERAKAFTDLAFTMIRADRKADAMTALKAHENSLVAKAAAHALGDDIWNVDDARAIAAAYLESIAESSVLDQILRYSHPIGTGRRVMVASGAVGDVVAEGDPKVITNLDLSIGNVEPTKIAAIVVMTKELAFATGDAGRRLFENELRKAVTRASNQSVLTALTNSNTVNVAGSGDPLADLRAGLQAAGPSAGYVVAAPSGAVADLATRVENRGGMSVRGGTFVPGVEVVAVDDISGMHVIPASRLAIWDSGLRVRSAEHATVTFAASAMNSTTPTGGDEFVNLWQTNSVGLLAERQWHLAQAAEIVVVGGAS